MREGPVMACAIGGHWSPSVTSRVETPTGPVWMLTKRCAYCAQWMTLGEANDHDERVRIEIRAAQLAAISVLVSSSDGIGPLEPGADTTNGSPEELAVRDGSQAVLIDIVGLPGVTNAEDLGWYLREKGGCASRMTDSWQEGTDVQTGWLAHAIAHHELETDESASPGVEVAESNAVDRPAREPSPTQSLTKKTEPFGMTTARAIAKAIEEWSEEKARDFYEHEGRWPCVVCDGDYALHVGMDPSPFCDWCASSVTHMFAPVVARLVWFEDVCRTIVSEHDDVKAISENNVTILRRKLDES